ncbi:HD domain-containing phosphohydrolase [Pleionea sediminis]|uniref:HD domain-containing phosphohydrolase n=1 Tax=Pleionea sediminis TaxID=2569479 RepID=UPI00118727BB|nr:HD domain-containing phosphohydrolase [Pleionea sediminis]
MHTIRDWQQVMGDLDDKLVFADESPEDESGKDANYERWELLVVDDESEVHEVTKLSLKGFEFAKRKLSIDSAFSAAEARSVLAEKDYAVILLDVVMETDHAGLDLVHWIRNVHQDQHVRIILRTGQPGQAPEKAVIQEYDINDYKEKTELTSNKLHTLMYASLRSYRDIISLFRNKQGLESIIVGADKIFSQHSLMDFTQGALEQLTSLLKADEGAFFGNIEGLAATLEENETTVLAATGPYKPYLNRRLEAALAKIPEVEVHNAIASEGLIFGDDYFIGVYRSHLKRKNILFMDGLPKLTMLDERLLKMFCSHLGVAFDNIALMEEVEITQRELVYRMSEAVESRSKETSNHVKRVAHISRLLGECIKLDEHECDVLFMAAPLHDIGKIATPDHILNKPGKLTDEEWVIMRQHAQTGRDILADSKLEVLSAGSAIAGDHHEKWDGTGYPKGKKGEDIHIYGRIVAIADVFDALYNKRCYKEAWSIGEIIQLFNDQKGKQFDPELVDKLLYNVDKVINIQNTYPD